MTILLANDDGYQSEGIHVLEEVLLESGHTVWVCAPSTQRSACSHAMTLSSIAVTRYGENHYHLAGFPADCVLYSLKGKLFPTMPDLVISGINHGYNISTDTLYSGTIGAASEAALMGIPSIALSCAADKKGHHPFRESAQFLVSHLDEFRAICSSTAFVSINVPPDTDGKTWSPATLGYLDYNDTMLQQVGKDEQLYDGTKAKFGTSIILELKGSAPSMAEEGLETDFRKIQAGVISVSVLSMLPAIDRNGQEKLRSLSESYHG